MARMWGGIFRGRACMLASLLGGLIAVLIIAAAEPAATQQIGKAEAEGMARSNGNLDVATDPAASPYPLPVGRVGNALRWSGGGGTATATVDVQGTGSAVVIRNRQNGAGRFTYRVYLDGVLLGERRLRRAATSYGNRVFNVPVAPGVHKIRVRTLDDLSSGERHLLDHVYVDASSTPVRPARQADSLVGSIGVATHFAFNSTGYATGFDRLKQDIGELGVRHIRDGAVLWHDSRDAAIYGRYKTLHQDYGVRTTLNFDLKKPDLNPISASKLDEIYRLGGDSIEAVEGANEHNLSDKCYTNTGCGPNPDWAAEVASYQRQLFAAVNASSRPNTPVLCPALGKEGGDYPPSSETPELGAYCDVNNTHSYPGGNPPVGGGMIDPKGYSTLRDEDIPAAYRMGDPSHPTVATETGYMDAVPYGNAVPEDVKAKYTPMLALEYFNSGLVKREYLYQLYDHRSDGPTNPQSHYGLINANFAEKPTFRALENTIDILEDPGPSFQPHGLAYRLSGELPDDLHTTLLEKRDGTFYLAMWRHARLYDWRDTYEERLNVTPAKVTVALGRPAAKVEVFDPTNIASAGPGDDAENHPSRTLSGVSSITEPVGGRVEILKITP